MIFSKVSCGQIQHINFFFPTQLIEKITKEINML